MTDFQHFWSRVNRSDLDSCWPWTGKPDREGYGHLRLGGRNFRAHRLACTLAHGEPPQSDSQACHSTKCTTRLRCNPDHLRWDSPAGNQHDVAITGSRRGEKNPKSVLTSDLVRLIWSRRHEGPTAIATALSVPRGAVRHVIEGYNWRHITGATPGTSWRPDPAAIAAAILSAAERAP